MINNIAARLSELADHLEALAKQASPFTEPLQRVRDAANEVGLAWCGSWFGYHSRVYHTDLQPVPAGVHFNTQFGLGGNYLAAPTDDAWHEYTFDSVRKHIFGIAKVRSLEEAERKARELADVFREKREDVLSALSVALQERDDAFMGRLKTQAETLSITSKFEYAQAARPSGTLISSDMKAIAQGIQTPPHITVIAEVCAIRNVSECCDVLIKLARRAASHLNIREPQTGAKRVVGTKVFIGHGRSAVWRDLKDFVQDRLILPWDEFNRVPIAGVTNITRLSQMLDDAAIAFLVLTGEDEQADAKVHPRLNVVHEAGLFQGRLGFARAIVLLEEGCEEFSNIDGLGQIRFPKGNIKAVFEEIRRVLEREDLVDV